MIKDVIGQPVYNGQRCVFITSDYNFSNKGRFGTVDRVTDKAYYVIFDKKPGNVRGTRMTEDSPVIVNIDAIADKYPENFL